VSHSRMARDEHLDLGLVFTVVVAVVVTVWDAWFFLVSDYSVPPAWAWLQLLVLAGAWGAVAAWMRRRWTLAGIGLSLTLGGVWGYFYIPPLVALVLAGVAFARAVRSSRARQRPATL
jgi:hypothetical protein